MKSKSFNLCLILLVLYSVGIDFGYGSILDSKADHANNQSAATTGQIVKRNTDKDDNLKPKSKTFVVNHDDDNDDDGDDDIERFYLHLAIENTKGKPNLTDWELLQNQLQFDSYRFTMNCDVQRFLKLKNCYFDRKDFWGLNNETIHTPYWTSQFHCCAHWEFYECMAPILLQCKPEVHGISAIYRTTNNAVCPSLWRTKFGCHWLPNWLLITLVVMAMIISVILFLIIIGCCLYQFYMRKNNKTNDSSSKQNSPKSSGMFSCCGKNYNQVPQKDQSTEMTRKE